MKYALCIALGAILAGAVVWGVCSSIASRNEADHLATVGHLRSEIAGLKTIAGNLGRLNSELEARVKSSSGRVVRSVVYVDRIKELNLGVGKQINESLDDIGFIRATIEGLPVLEMGSR